jgi:hypothetical protein
MAYLMAYLMADVLAYMSCVLTFCRRIHPPQLSASNAIVCLVIAPTMGTLGVFTSTFLAIVAGVKPARPTML